MKSLFEKNLIEQEDSYHEDLFTSSEREDITGWLPPKGERMHQFGKDFLNYNIDVKTENGVIEWIIFETSTGDIILSDSASSVDLQPEYRGIDDEGEENLRNWKSYNVPEELIQLVLKLANNILEYRLKKLNK